MRILYRRLRNDRIYGAHPPHTVEGATLFQFPTSLRASPPFATPGDSPSQLREDPFNSCVRQRLKDDRERRPLVRSPSYSFPLGVLLPLVVHRIVVLQELVA